MSDAPKLLTRDVLERFAVSPALEAELHKRGLIAQEQVEQEPVNPMLIEARKIAAQLARDNHQPWVPAKMLKGECDHYSGVKIAFTALNRAREIGLAERPELTRPELVKLLLDAGFSVGRGPQGERKVDRLHAALTGADRWNQKEPSFNLTKILQSKIWPCVITCQTHG